MVTIYALMMAGFIPQCIPTRLPNADIVFELAALSGAKALLHHSSVACPVSSPLPTHEIQALGTEELTSTQECEFQAIDPDDIVAIYHTSGSTGNLPKLVTFTGRRLATIAHTHARILKIPYTRNWL